MTGLIAFMLVALFLFALGRFWCRTIYAWFVPSGIAKRKAEEAARKERWGNVGKKLFAPPNAWPAPSGAAVSPSAKMRLGDELKKLAELRDKGILTEQEFAAPKAKLLG
jgi:hypothetical protein